MPHIHTGAGQHDHTVTAYIVRTDTAEPMALMHMHKKLKKLLPVGGHVELNENPWQAMEHELQEESGYTLADLNILQTTSRIARLKEVTLHPYPISMNTHAITDDHFHSDTEYAFVASADPTTPINEGESEDLRWLTQAELNQLDDSLAYPSTKEVYNFIFDEALKHWEQIPATRYGS